MQTINMTETFATLFRELVHGAPEEGGFMLNAGDPGLLAVLESLPADEASATSAGGASVAAHVDHIRYGLSLMNRWSEGENPFQDADWASSWEIGAVSQAEWDELRQSLRDEAERWLEALADDRDVNQRELNGMVGSIVHLAYHLGAIRQINPRLRGPREGE